MSPQPKKASSKSSSKSTKTAADLTPDQVDAVLRDPNVPGDVRSIVADSYSVARYLESVTFTEDRDGVVHVEPKE